MEQAPQGRAGEAGAECAGPDDGQAGARPTGGRIKDLGEPNVDGSSATLIDTLHRYCAFGDKCGLPVRGTQTGTGGVSEYLARSGHGRNEKLWTVAQAISEVLPDGDKEKQLLQGLLNQRDKIDEAMAEGRLF